MNENPKTYRVLAVDDEPGILSALQRQLRKTAFELVTVGSGKEALNLLANERFQLIISDMRMPEMDGAEFLGRVKAEWPDTVRILLTGYSEMEATVKAINDGGIFSYLSKPWEREDLLALLERAAQHYQLHRNRQIRLVKASRKAQALEDSHKALSQKLAETEDAVARSKAFIDMARQEIELAYDTAVEVFANLIDLKTPGETGINREVAQCAQFLATIMGLPATEQRNVRLAGMLYNVGKIGLASDLTSRPENQLNDREQQLFRRYPKLGESALLALSPLNQVTQLIALHRECLDGSGFPMGLSQTALPASARILAVAVCFRELCKGRRDGKMYEESEAISWLRAHGRQYDPEVVHHLATLVSEQASQAAEERMQEVSGYALQPGMVLARDLHSTNGILLLSRGHRLDRLLISKLVGMETQLADAILIVDETEDASDTE